MRRSLISRALDYLAVARHARNLRRNQDEVVRARSRDIVIARLGRLRGLGQKVGQITVLRGDAECAPYEKLTDSCDPLPWRVIRKELRRSWGCKPEERLAWVDEHGFGASIGQVHKTRLHDGRTVAVKVRYPGIRKAIFNDLRLLGWAVNRALEVPEGAEFEGHRRAILDNLEAELDYRREAANQVRFRAALAELSAPRLANWIVPQVIESLSTDRVLVTAWEEGERIDQAGQWPQAEKHALAQQLALGLVSLLLCKGVAQGDPHPGNYRFVRAGESPKIVVYDFGCLISLDEPQRTALTAAFRAFVEGSDPYQALRDLGFRPEILDQYRPALPMLCRAIFQPLWHSQAGLFDWDQLGGDGLATRQSGPLTLLMHIPPHLLFVLRAFRGLHAYAQRLGASIDWKAVQAALDGRLVACALRS